VGIPVRPILLTSVLPGLFNFAHILSRVSGSDRRYGGSPGISTFDGWGARPHEIGPRARVSEWNRFLAPRRNTVPNWGSAVPERRIPARLETFFAQGSAADSIFFLQKGRAKLTVVSKAGKEATITLLSAGDFIGEESIVAVVGLRLATATAIAAFART